MTTLKESILKSVRAGKYAHFPKTKEELVEMIKKEIRENGNNCSLNHINVSQITDMSYLFSTNKIKGYGLSSFNGDISGWDVSKVTNMFEMFFGSNFNQPLNDWNVSRVENMCFIFCRNKEFNQPLDKWDVSNVIKMTGAFQGTNFNQDISNWKINPDCQIYLMFNSCNIKDKYKPFQNGKQIK